MRKSYNYEIILHYFQIALVNSLDPDSGVFSIRIDIFGWIRIWVQWLRIRNTGSNCKNPYCSKMLHLYFYCCTSMRLWVLRSRSHLEPPVLRWSRSRFFCCPELRVGAAFFKAAPAVSFWQAKKESLVVVAKHDLRVIYSDKCDPKRVALIIHF